jgi:hypothetical protein
VDCGFVELLVWRLAVRLPACCWMLCTDILSVIGVLNPLLAK